MSTYNYKMFKYFSRKFHLTQQSAPPDVWEAFTKYTGGAPTMSAEQLWLFLVEHQSETECTEGESKRIVEYMHRYRQHSGQNKDQKNKSSNDAESNDSNGLTLDDFFDFLLLDSFNYPIKPKQVHHDMNLPLSHYFIYTGHNSYLTGNQLSSDCSDVPIIKALHRGVRVIELDLWPNSAKDGIEVVHGRTLTAPVSLTQCYVAIREHAFAASQYPVIITLEDHLTPDLRAMVAELTTQIFGDLLYYPDQTEGMKEFPTPESLKGRILLSTRPPTEFIESKIFRDKDYERESPDEGGSSPSPANNGVEADERSNASDGEEEDLNANGKKSSPTNYKRLITIHAGKPKGHLRDSLKIDGHVRRLSLSEQELEKASASYGTDLVRYTQKHIIRVYPKGTRVTSSNYRPHIGWIYGAQMVALNMQGYGKSLWYMQGMFRANGGCGYVRKPSLLMEKNDRDEDFDPKRILPVKKILKVKVYMGTGWSSDFSKTHFDTFSPPDFYTRVGVVGVAADKMSKKTKVIFDNWFPVWHEEFEFPLTVPELALLSVEVREYDKHEKDDFGGQTCLPLFELRPGFRAVPLYDERGDKFQNVKLLMRFQFR